MTSKALYLTVALMLVSASAVWAEPPVQAEADRPIGPPAVCVVPPAKTKLAFAPDYSWVIGKLLHRDLEGGFWQIQFIPAGTPKAQKNPHRGKFVLGNPVQLKGYKSGDVVRITGRLAPAGMMSTWQAGTIYQLKTVQRVGAGAAKPAPPKKLTPAEVVKLKKLLAELGSDDFQTRERAEAEIKKLGPAALGHVQPLARSEDAEIAERAGRIVEHLESLLPPKPSKVSVTLSLDKAKYKIGERIALALKFKNDERKAVQLPGGGSSYPWLSAMAYELTDPDGKAVAKGQILLAVRKAMYMMPITLPAGAAREMKTSVTLSKDAPKGRMMPAVRILRARLGAAPQKAPAIAPPKGIAYLLFSQSGSYFALPKAGKYTLKFRLAGRDPSAPAVKRGQVQPGRGGVQIFRLQNGAGQVQIQVQGQGAVVLKQQIVIQAGGAAVFVGPDGVRGKANPLVGTVESNAVTFEVVVE